MRIRLALTLDIHRDHAWTPEPEVEHAPEATVKGSSILERRPTEDHDDTKMPPPPYLGFGPNARQEEAGRA